MIKPDAVAAGNAGAIIKIIEDHGFVVNAMKLTQLTPVQACQFYRIHKNRPFYNDLVNFMISGPVVVQVLEGDNAVKLNRDVMGATNPDDAEEGTIRKEFAESIEANSVHGSDSLENAQNEISFFFANIELVN